MIRAVRFSPAELPLAGGRSGLLKTEGLIGEAPEEREATAVDRASPSVRVGVWACGAYAERIVDYAVDEFMVVVSGSVEIGYDDGGVDTFRAGDAFLLPKGFTGTWRQPEPMVKYFAIIA